MKKVVVVALVGALSFSALPVLAHHSASMFEPVNTVTVTGVVKQFEYANPHAWLILDVMGSGGDVTTWSFEMGEVSVLQRVGIHKQDFMPGTQVTITGHPMKDGRKAGSFTQAVRADGVVFSARGQAKPAGQT